MRTREEALAFALSFPDTYQDAPFRDDNWQLVRVKGSKKAFLWTYERNGYMNLNVKVDPEWRDYWRDAFASVVPGWHQNREHWNTIILDGSVPDDAVREMIAESYRLVTDSPSKRIYEAVKKIPRGKVATYGQVAELAGDKKMARAVGNALHKNPDMAAEGYFCRGRSPSLLLQKYAGIQRATGRLRCLKCFLFLPAIIFFCISLASGSVRSGWS